MKHRHLFKKITFLILSAALVSAFALGRSSGNDFELISVTPQLVVRDVALAATFYQEKLGFEILQREKENDVMNYALLRLDNIMIAFKTDRKLREDFPGLRPGKPANNINLIFRSNNVKAIYDKVKGRTEIIKELQTTFYGASEFSLRDPNGYLLTFAQLAD